MEPANTTHQNVRILLTGDYWHRDFRPLLHQLSCYVTMAPIEALISESKDSNSTSSCSSVDLVVVAISVRDQIDSATLETISQINAPTPVVCLLGSWCEGETRSGHPPAGIPRVYWHQWQGRFERFVEAINGDKVSPWSLPRTANDSDQIQAASNLITGSAAETSSSKLQPQRIVAVSALTAQSYEMLADAIKSLGGSSQWIEMLAWEAKTITTPSLICIDADSWSPECEVRIRDLRGEFGRTPIAIFLNFPREDELESLKNWGIDWVVSKPFQLGDLKTIIDQPTLSQT